MGDRDRGDPEALARKPFGDREAEASTGARDDDIIHAARAFRRRSSACRRRTAASTGTMCGARLRAAGGEDFALQSRMRHALVAQHHVGEDERARDRILAREHAARADRLMRVERRLDLFRVNLGAADIDDAAAPADKIEPVAAPLDHVAGVDEAVLVGERRRSGAEKAQSATVGTHAQARRRRPSSGRRRRLRARTRESPPCRHRPRRRRRLRSRRRHARCARADRARAGPPIRRRRRFRPTA